MKYLTLFLEYATLVIGFASFLFYLKMKRLREAKWWLLGSLISFALVFIAKIAIDNSKLGSFIDDHTKAIFLGIFSCFLIFIIVYPVLLSGTIRRGAAMKQLGRKYNLTYKKKDEKGNKHILEGYIGKSHIRVYDFIGDLPIGGIASISERSTIVIINNDKHEYQGRITGYYPTKKLDSILENIF